MLATISKHDCYPYRGVQLMHTVLHNIQVLTLFEAPIVACELATPRLGTSKNILFKIVTINTCMHALSKDATKHSAAVSP